ncbi:MAG TPA: DUF3224 domain-containing protein [Pyrinomonadaceae bacterium]|nr:DUF3224 domain-containing protein [Pyrinomonadaceae bacterium]
MNLKVKSSFKITAWEPVTDENDEIADIARARIRKEFAGDMTGTSVANAILYQTPVQSGGYSAIERITATIGDRVGTFVVQHSGIRDAEGKGPFYGDIVPGSGTGDFEGVIGSMQIGQGESGEYFLLDLNLV